MRYITASSNFTYIIDDEDYNKVSKLNWFTLDKNSKYKYAAAKNKPIDYTRNILLHRLVMNAKKGEVVDHINGNVFDNRKNNLRICTRGQNIMNQRLRSNNSSGYKGVYFDKRLRKWCVRIQTNGIRKYFGFFDNLVNAARCYNKNAKRLHGEFAKLNTI